MNTSLRTAGCIFLLAAAALGQPRTIPYHPKLSDLKYVYGELPPALHVKPGDTAEMVDPNHVVIAKINEKFLPRSAGR